jgi:hypothetical protein
MFGLPKLLLLALVVAAVWYGFRYLQARERQLARTRRPADKAVGAAARSAAVTEDLVKCAVCATYVARAAPACGRADCPQPRSRTA